MNSLKIISLFTVQYKTLVMKKTKLNLEKFTVAKLISPEKIFGGNGNETNGNDTQTDTLILERPGTITRLN